MTKLTIRQGDVGIVPIAKLPTNLTPVERDKGRVVLAYGEVTGHAHAIKHSKAALFRDPTLAAVFMLVTGDEPVALEHEEHSTIMLAPGAYRIEHQREYVASEITRNVAD